MKPRDTDDAAEAAPVGESRAEAAADVATRGARKQVASIGRVVHYVLDKPYSAGEPPAVRPAIVVLVWGHDDQMVNLQVFTDGKNDGAEYASGLAWKTSRKYSEGREPGTWHWPPRS